MRDAFAGFDAWLERPYQDMVEESDRYMDWCDANELDPDEPSTQDLYAEAVTDDYEYEPDDDDIPDWWEIRDVFG